MYDFDYTYLTELEVDTRQSFVDLSDDLLLLYNSTEEESQTVNMKNTISSWQDFFWKSSNPEKNKLRPTFTDLSVEHETSALDDNEIMTYGELLSFFADLDTRKQWAGGRTFTELSNDLVDAIESLQTLYANPDKVYPVKSMLVSDINPNSEISGMTWTKIDNKYVSEVFSSANIKELSGGTVDGCGSIENALLKPTTEKNKVPSHTHQLSLIPPTGKGGTSTSSVVATADTTWDSEYYGTRITTTVRSRNSSSIEEVFTGNIDNDASGHGSYDTMVGIIATDANTSIDGDDVDAEIKFKVTTTEVKPADSSINVAPKTYPINTHIWERNA